MTKKELRGVMKKQNLAITPEARAAASERIFSRVAELPGSADARCVALFCALPDEPPTDEALRCWCGTKRILVPRVEGDTMSFYDYNPSAMCAGAFGIAEPSVAELPCDPSDIDFMVVSGVAFTSLGARMGRGRGYYDKYLSQPGFRAVKVGICYAHQLVAELPVEPHDVPMDYVITNN